MVASNRYPQTPSSTEVSNVDGMDFSHHASLQDGQYDYPSSGHQTGVQPSDLDDHVHVVDGNSIAHDAVAGDASASIPFFDNTFDMSYLSGNSNQDFSFASANFSQDLFNIWDLDLDSIEMAYQVDISGKQGGTKPPDSDARSTPREVSKRHAAFERSPWLYKPTSKDHALNDQANLTLDEDSITELTPSSPETNIAEFSFCCINSKIRDQMLGVIFSIGKTVDKVPSFPSLALLNTIIQVFFAQESFKTDNLLHTGSFEPSNMLPQLLVAVVAAGSVQISEPVIWKMGLALQEVVRHAVANLWEQNNSNTRNLQVLQAFMICLDIGLWSGFKRQMEIAESFGQPIIVMIRRSGAFGSQRSSSAIVPEMTDSATLLESKWKKWAEAESYKRLIIHLFIHDTHASIGMQKPPLIYLTELKFALPAPQDLWLARSATEWRDLDHKHRQKSPTTSVLPTFMEAIQNIDLLESVAQQIDAQLCTLALLHGFWGQIWTYHQSKRFYPESNSTHRLCLITEHRELYRDLSEFSTRIPSLTRNSQITIMLSELLMMLLHADPDDLQRFAGKYGEEEAKQAAFALRAWSKTPESRTAIWHAGQVLRAARRVTTARLRGFNAIAVYYASLTLWIYGLMTTPLSPTSGQQSASAAKFNITHITLNEAASPQTRLFLSSNEGVPGLVATRDGGLEFVPLHATDRVLRLARDIYRNNFPVLEEPLPPLVDNLGNLLRDLESLPGSKVSRAGSEMI
ncbi:hypothetical protein BP5796_03936 [Coleophoma crateriformis]|uniref:Xylanolytic transcriptional activator regulatory domain-containing protein n=1 Tax=Coleophoma crateriformis TaxID=565419 RepID=A0A3D8SHG1_9HELO|nr:hypothetical protein BP5796_03936 [Coleophoma crateriformis]